MRDVTTAKAYENLANAIVLQAIKDYKNYYNRAEVVNFFRSQWYNELTDIPASGIMKICNDKCVKASFQW